MKNVYLKTCKAYMAGCHKTTLSQNMSLKGTFFPVIETGNFVFIDRQGIESYCQRDIGERGVKKPIVLCKVLTRFPTQRNLISLGCILRSKMFHENAESQVYIVKSQKKKVNALSPVPTACVSAEKKMCLTKKRFSYIWQC